MLRLQLSAFTDRALSQILITDLKVKGHFFALIKSFTDKIFEAISSLDCISSFQVMG